MPNSPHSSRESVSCRLEWRPSRWLAGALILLAALAVFSVLVSEMPRWMAWPVAPLALAYAAWLLRRQSRLPRLQFFFPGNEQPVMLQGLPVQAVQAVQAVRVEWRGPLAFISWEGLDGRRQRLAWWPDTLPAARRRELRLAAGALEAARQGPAMAP